MGEEKEALVLERETKRMVRYHKPNAEPGEMNTVYVPKRWFGDEEIPDKITVTVSW